MNGPKGQKVFFCADEFFFIKSAHFFASPLMLARMVIIMVMKAMMALMAMMAMMAMMSMIIVMKAMMAVMP